MGGGAGDHRLSFIFQPIGLMFGPLSGRFPFPRSRRVSKSVHMYLHLQSRFHILRCVVFVTQERFGGGARSSQRRFDSQSAGGGLDDDRESGGGRRIALSCSAQPHFTLIYSGAFLKD
nr:hypothetical protein Iba_scaffold525516CG0010 [Ipomoea batatas]